MTWLPRVAFAPAQQATRGNVLVCIFQRGGIDGLNALVPMGDRDYYQLRPTLAIAETKNGDNNSAINLDGFFGLHPALVSLKPIYDAGVLAPIHACGSPDPSHSHFDAMDAMERAVRDGRITQERLAQSVARVARLKSQYLHPYRPVTISDARLVVGCRTHRMLLELWHKAYARVPLPKTPERVPAAAVSDSPVTHV